MNNKGLVKLSNLIGVISIILLVYWVFVFISITVFGLKVFKENLTETFYLSVVGILALMVGALIINIMFNLTRIAEKHNQDDLVLSKGRRNRIWLFFVLSFPILFGLLVFGDFLTSNRKEQMLVSAAKSIVSENSKKAEHLLNYSFNKEWIAETESNLEMLSKTDENFPNISLIVADTIQDSHVFLGFDDYAEKLNDTVPPKKKDYIQKTTEEERRYLNKVFKEGYKEIRFSASDGRYELFFPYVRRGKKIVLYFSDYQRYGKIGS
jgi:hypothetical protein